MFSLLRRRGDAFQQRQKKQEVWKCLRRVLDRNSITGLLPDDDVRSVKRFPYCSPVMLQLCSNDQPAPCEPVFAISKDLSDDGIALITNQPLEEVQVLCVLWQDGPHYILGDVRQCQYVGGGFWKVGVQLTEIVSSEDFPTLPALSEQLNPEFERV